VASALEKLSGEEIEDRVFAAGGIAAAVRTLAVWHAHPQGRALAAEPLISHRSTGSGAPRSRGPSDVPLADVRVLDLTRVIAGPVCTRFLGALGAQVVRLDPPGHRDMAAGAAADTLVGKRSSFLDIGTPVGAAVLEELLDEADVVVGGYRPGSLDRFGLDEESLTARHPGIVAVYLDAWGHSGPWSDRRGFDSVVQAPTGIAMGEARRGDEPGALPCQILDHGTGYLAAAAMDGLRRQWAEGGTVIRRLSLARTALWLTSIGTQPDDGAAVPATEPDPPPPWLVELESADGPVTAVSPPGTLGDRPLRWPSPVTGYGTDPARWST
jgi:crotonobetainyl-CoA:carnitine CoA-transferase CaiB-like acyl-CoA transferase